VRILKRVNQNRNEWTGVRQDIIRVLTSCRMRQQHQQQINWHQRSTNTVHAPSSCWSSCCHFTSSQAREADQQLQYTYSIIPLDLLAAQMATGCWCWWKIRHRQQWCCETAVIGCAYGGLLLESCGSRPPPSRSVMPWLTARYDYVPT